jgi:hypothetical protein
VAASAACASPKVCTAPASRSPSTSATPAPTVRRQGYRIHLGGIGATALADCLPPASYQLLLATAGRPGGQVTVATKRLRRLRVMPGAPGGQAPSPAGVSVAVNRLTVREIMLADLGDLVRFGAEFTHYEPEGAGVRAHFANGDSVVADVLVGADGIGSRVRQQLLPHAEVIDTGTRVIYGKVLLDATTRALLPADVKRGFLAVRAIPRPIGLALGLVEFAEPVAEAAARLGVRLTPIEDYLMFALTAPARCFPHPDAVMSTLDGARLRATAIGMTRRWHPNLRELLARCVAGPPTEHQPRRPRHENRRLRAGNGGLRIRGGTRGRRPIAIRRRVSRIWP